MWRSSLVSGLHHFFQGVDLQQGLQGWGRVRWGQSFDAVKLNYPQAVENNGKLTLSSEDPSQRHWSLDFGFDSSHRLSSVSLTFAGGEETADFADINREITRRLGPPAQTSSSGNIWLRDDTQVSLSRLPEGGLVLSENV
ncbi:MAG: hypothetical protein PVG03_03950 [Desulfarculaceae bacterium]|jgi:hypothetical protein